MKNILLLTALIFCLTPGTVLGYPVYLNNFTGDPAEVLLEITGDGTSSINFDVRVVSPEFADLRGVWFNFEPFPQFPNSLTVTGPAITGWSFIENNVGNLGTGNNITPRGSFDAGISIGLAGLRGGSDDYFHTNFTVGYSEPISLGGLFGARLTSVGDSKDDREGSSKLVGNATPVPEPTTTLLLGAGLIGLIIARRKFRK